jgi:uncharacterized protein (TIGR03118 family)
MFMQALESRRLLSGATLTVTNLISDGAIPAAHTDANLVNPWGVAFAPGGEFWIADNGKSVSTLNTADGTALPLVVSIPGGGGGASAPTGQVFNGTGGFVVSKAGLSGPAQFIFVGEDGGISGWSPNVDGTNAVLTVDQSAQGAVFKGAAIATSGRRHHTFLYVTDFHNGKVDIFDSTFTQVNSPNAFVDPQTPAGFAPFNVQAVGSILFVTYAKQNALKHDDVAGAGNGFVDEFDTSGNLIRRLQHVSALNSPWGVSQAPASWGPAQGDILVGQFGSGQVAAFNIKSGKFEGLVRRTADNKPIVIDGLWALTFGNGGQAGPTSTLFFTAGPNGESDGLFGSMTIHLTTATAHHHRTTSAAGGTLY